MRNATNSNDGNEKAASSLQPKTAMKIESGTDQLRFVLNALDIACQIAKAHADPQHVMHRAMKEADADLWNTWHHTFENALRYAQHLHAE